MKTIILPLLMLACPQAALAGSAGADPFNFLFLDAGARPVALGGAYTALARDANALLYNPAGLGEIKEHQVVFMHNMYFQEISQDYLSYASPQGWGLSFNYLGFGSVRRTTVSNPTGAGLGKVGMSDMALCAGYGASIATNFVAGAGGKYVSESVAGVAGRGFGLDLGLLYFPPGLEKAVFGAAVQNIGPDVKFQSADEKMPLNLRLGGTYGFKVLGRASSLSADVTKARGEDMLAAFGLETMAGRAIALRFGYSARNAAGPGISVGLGYARQNLAFDYAFVPFGDLGAAHRLSAGYKWGGNGGKPVKPPPVVKKRTTEDYQADYERLVSSARDNAGKQDYAAAAADYTKALSIKPGDAQVQLGFAEALMRTNRFREADSHFEAVLKQLPETDPRRAYITERRGEALFRQDMTGAAKKYFKQAIAIAEEGQIPGPALENAYYGLAYCLEKEDRNEEAIQNYRMALQLAGSEALKKQIEKRLGSLVMQHR